MTTFPMIAIIGAGNMGSALIHGLIQSGHPPNQLVVADPDQEKLNALAVTHGIMTSLDNAVAIKNADVVIFAIKPQQFGTVAALLADSIQTQKPLIISVAAGITTHQIAEWLGNNIAIVRAMPNMPALIGSGATGLYANTAVTASDHRMAESILRTVGIIVWLEREALLDVVTALSGSGPAYFFLMMEALEETAQSLGLNQDDAHLLTLETALGSARLALTSKESLIALRERVTSKGGTTEKALAVLESHHLKEIFKQAIMAAKERAEELGPSKK